jgi:hypothetical protein
MEHVVIYKEPGRYAGWPANYGIWSWDDEIVVGFTVGYHDSSGGFHARDRNRPFVGMQARSLDGGATWEVVDTPCRAPSGKGLSANEHMNEALGIGSVTDDLEDCPGDIDFSNPDGALMCARTGLRAGAVSWFYASTDRCRSWQGPYRLPMFGLPGIAARTDYLVSGANTCVLFLTAAKSDGKEGRVFCARTTDGGRQFSFLSWIGDEPEGYGIMPASVRLPDGRILAAVRCQEGGSGRRRNWIDLYQSEDEGGSWTHVNTPVENTGNGGNPPAMLLLRDGRLCITYGYRDAPFGIRARLSEDGGATWSADLVLRDDGGNHDVGYTRSVQRPDGSVVTVYYYDDHPDTERYVAATIWEP